MTAAPSSTPAPDAPRAFATTSRFRGDCAPAGSRGGCDEYTFSPDGSASHMLYDARISGRYRIEGGAVVFSTNAPDASEERLPLTENGTVLGGRYRLQP